MRVRHFGNTANNAYYNARVLQQYEGIASELPIAMYGWRHAISAPAWEAVDFDVPGADWVHEPDWSRFPQAAAVNAEYTDLPATGAGGPAEAAPMSASPLSRLVSTAGRAIAPLRGKRWAQPIFDRRERKILAGGAVLFEAPDEIAILYGADSLGSLRLAADSTRAVCLEHGTIRWIADGSPEQRVRRAAYREQVQNAAHLWVTNLDPRTLEIAEDLVPGRWSALPHPYVPDPRVPFAESPRRQTLLQSTGSEALVLLPSSQNWGKHHDKGSMRALTAFVDLRRAGADAGLVAVEWGLQLAESKQFLERAGVAASVAWVPPMARFALQRMMADVDVVWDQFGLEAFGGVANRAVEQGTPFISRGLAPAGEKLIGGPVPWRHAATTDDIVRETTQVLDEISLVGRPAVIRDHQTRYRTWLLERHSPKITAILQREVYASMLDGTLEAGSQSPDRWAQLIAEGIREDG